MKNIIKGAGMFVAITLVVIVMFNINNASVKKSETAALANTASYDALKVKVTSEYDFENNDDLVAEVIKQIAINKNTNSDVKVQILGIDAENGLLDINVIETIKHANGEITTEEQRRTVIVETVKHESTFLYDFNNDGAVDHLDADYIADYYQGLNNAVLTEEQKNLADFDGNNTINADDVRIFKEKIDAIDTSILQKRD